MDGKLNVVTIISMSGRRRNMKSVTNFAMMAELVYA